MNDTHRKIIRKHTSYLIHYNQNHDKLGRFASSNLGGVSSVSSSGKVDIKGEKDDVFEINNESLKLKNHKLKSIRSDLRADHGYDFTTGKGEYWLVGDSSTKVHKEEVRSKNGVHLIKTKPTSFMFHLPELPSGGVDKKKLKTLDSFAVSRGVSKAIREGQKFGADRNGYEGKHLDWTPEIVAFEFDEKGNPTLDVMYTHKDIDFDSHMINVEFDEKLKPRSTTYDG